MNNTIFRRKFILGVLIALVFGFGVHGTVDALTNLEKTSGDVALIGPHTTATATFVFTLSDVVAYDQDTDPGTDGIQRGPSGDQISLNVRNGRITSIAGTDIPTTGRGSLASPQSNITLRTDDPDDPRTFGTNQVQITENTEAVTVTCRPSQEGEIRLTVTHSHRSTGGDPTTDLSVQQSTLTFVAYAVRPDSEIQGVTIDEAASIQSPQFRYSESPSSVKVQLTGSTDLNYVRVQLVSTNGELSDDLNNDGIADVTGTTITTFTNDRGVAEVSLAPGTASSRVTASIPQTAADEYLIIYAFREITIAHTAPTSTLGLISEPVDITVFRVRDGAAAGLEGIEVTLEVLDPGGYMEKAADFDFIEHNDDFSFVKVITDADGDVEVKYLLGPEPGIYRLRATAEGAKDPAVFAVQADAIRVGTTEVASIEIFSGDGQQTGLDQSVANPLVVKVRDVRGLAVAGAPVTFTTNSGTLLFPADGDPPIAKRGYGRYNSTNHHDVTAAIANNAQSSITIDTDRDGNAAVAFNVGNIPGVKQVLASVDIYDSQERHVTFTATASETATVTPPGNLSVTLSAASADPGDQVTVTVDAGDSDVPVTFTSSGLTLTFPSNLTTGSNGTVSHTFTVPSGTAAGRYTIRASADKYNDATADLTVRAVTVPVPVPTNTLSVLTPRPVQANAGDTYNVVVDAGAPNVTITLSGTGFQVTQGTTLANGSATIPVVIPSTAGSYQLYANATGYDQELIVVIVTGNVAPRTGAPVRLTIPSGQTQTVTIGNSATLQVLVTNTGTGSGQSGVEVTFRDSGGNDLATRTTDNKGEASYQFSVTSTARRLISAVITDTDVDTSGATPVTFAITGEVRQPTVSTRLTIIQPVDSLGQIMNTAGPGVAYPLTILFNNENNTPAVNQVVTITVRNAAQVVQSSTVLITDNTGRAVTPDTFRLPTAAGTYTITAVSGTQTRAVTVTVFAIRLVKDTSDSVSGDNQEGNRGEVLDEPFVVKVVRNSDSTAVQGVPVTFRVTDGDGELSTSSSATSGDTSITVNSDVNGDVQAYLVLDEDDEDNEVTASVGITGIADVTFEATGSLVPDSLEIVSGDDQQIALNQRSAPMVVRVTDEDGDDLEGVVVTFSWRGPGGGTLTPRTAETDRLGEAESELLPRAAGTYFITARVVGVTSVTFTINVGNLADDIEIVSGNNQRGDPGTQLDNPFVVEVLDEDGDTVSGVTVTFRVTGGGGSLSATSVSTNTSGRAQTYLTLGDSPGGNSVRASVSGVSTSVTFSATGVDPTPPEPVINLPASQRADTYWINTDSGTLHRLVGSSVEDIASGVNNVVSLVVTSDRLYWVEDTGNNSGRIRRSNLNGTNIQLIRDLTATPAGITVDTTNNKIYLTNAWGKVQSINLDGSGYAPNLITGLSDPKDIAVGSGKVYWITGGGTVHSANVDGSGVTQIASGYGTLGSIAVGGGKVFWTEEISESEGNIHSANLDGSGVQQVVSLLAAPLGISVDASANKLYFTNSRGRIMQSDLNGSGIQIVASNLVAPGDVSVPSGTTAPRPPGTFSRYDVNRDGTVDNTDASLVANALGESPPSNPNLDVNGDGVVNFLDLLLVFDNRDESSAAPIAVSERPKVSREEIQNQIEMLLASDNHSATAQFTLAYLQNLLEVVTPEKTRLLANYPNPFNPETWIPYQLATSSEVQITIYNSAGSLVRTLSLGHQSKGYYTDRSRAAYWDGRNAIGEHVASGIYFYTLTTDRISATRKMLILK